VPSASSSLWPGGSTSSAPPLILHQPPLQPPLSRQAREQDKEDKQDAPIPMSDRLPLLRAVGQVATTYVIAEGPDGMYLVDQHAAHERVLYEKFLASVVAGSAEVQAMLDPVTIELNAQQQALVNEHAPAMHALGFDIEHFGDSAYVVRAVPVALSGADVAARVVELLDRLRRDDSEGGQPDASHRVAASLACHAAVRAGMAMSHEEQRELLRHLEAAESPRTCPHGRPTMVHLTADAIAREFRRR
jgi:DNA mismatch repair protein MutL